MRPPCAVPAHRCPHEDPVQLHHVFGRDEHGHYVEPFVLLPLCQPEDHQRGVHMLLGRHRLGGSQEPTLGVLLGRLGCALCWLGWDRKGEAVVPASFAAGAGEWLLEQSRQLRGEVW